MNILYLHNSKTFGGSSKSLIEITKPLNDQINKIILTSSGNVIEHFKKENFKVYTVPWLSHFDNKRYGYYRGLRWIILLREFVYLPVSLSKLVQILRNEKVDLVHLNEALLFIYAPLIKKIFKKPIVLHVRSVQSIKKNIRRKIFEYIIRNYIDSIVAIDMTVLESLPKDYNIEIIHNGLFISTNLTKKNKIDSNEENPLVLGYIGVLYRAKGIYELLEAVKILIAEKNYKVKLLIAGHNTRNIKNNFIKNVFQYLGYYQDTKNDIQDFISKNNLNDYIDLLGFIENVKEFYEKIDILIFPTYFDAIGRPVIEAAYFGIPSIVAVSNPLPDTFIPYKTGFNISKPDVQELAKAIERFYLDRNLISVMGEEAKKLAQQNFDIESNANKLLKIYQKLTGNQS